MSFTAATSGVALATGLAAATPVDAEDGAADGDAVAGNRDADDKSGPVGAHAASTTAARAR
jgi:hypothetical protein